MCGYARSWWTQPPRRWGGCRGWRAAPGVGAQRAPQRWQREYAPGASLPAARRRAGTYAARCCCRARQQAAALRAGARRRRSHAPTPVANRLRPYRFTPPHPQDNFPSRLASDWRYERALQGLRLLAGRQGGGLLQTLLAWRQGAIDEIAKAYGGGGGVLNLQGLCKRVRGAAPSAGVACS